MAKNNWEEVVCVGGPHDGQKCLFDFMLKTAENVKKAHKRMKRKGPLSGDLDENLRRFMREREKVEEKEPGLPSRVSVPRRDPNDRGRAFFVRSLTKEEYHKLADPSAER